MSDLAKRIRGAENLAAKRGEELYGVKISRDGTVEGITRSKSDAPIVAVSIESEPQRRTVSRGAVQGDLF